MGTYGPICGHPVEFRNLDRPRDDYPPVCHRPPHEGDRHLSRAAMDRARERWRERRAQYEGPGRWWPRVKAGMTVPGGKQEA